MHIMECPKCETLHEVKRYCEKCHTMLVAKKEKKVPSAWLVCAAEKRRTTMERPETFEEFILECGYDANGPLNNNEQQVVNVARSAWKHRQLEIDKTNVRIARFKNALHDL